MRICIVEVQDGYMQNIAYDLKLCWHFVMQERLGLFMIVDAPSLFSVLWKAIETFVDRKTYKKIR